MIDEKQEARECFERAAAELKESMDDNQDDVSLIVQYADLMQKLERRDEAEKYYLTAIEKDPEEATALNNLGYMWIEKGEKLGKAIKLVERALEIEPGNSAFIDSLGWGLFKRGKYKDALAKLKEAVEAGANDPVVFDHLGDAYMKNKMYEEAVANWEKALELEPEDADKIREKIEAISKELEE
jgi:tetratricopeptide (TPR) repeat protein